MFLFALGLVLDFCGRCWLS